MAAKHIRRIAFALGAAGFCLAGGLAAFGQSADTAVMQPLPATDTALVIAPVRPANIHVLSASDHDIFMQAFAAADKGDWTNALALLPLALRYVIFGGEALERLLPAQPGVDQKASALGRDQGAVTGAGRRENRNRDDVGRSLSAIPSSHL